MKPEVGQVWDMGIWGNVRIIEVGADFVIIITEDLKDNNFRSKLPMGYLETMKFIK